MRGRRKRRGIKAGVSRYFFLALCSGLLLRLVEAIFSSSFSLIDEAIDFDAPLSLLLGVSPRLADKAAPAAFCWAPDFAGMVISPDAVLVWKQRASGRGPGGEGDRTMPLAAIALNCSLKGRESEPSS